MEQLWLDVLYVIPTGITPHKVMHGDATATDRLNMLRLAFAGVEGVVISDMEIRREGKSYTVDTLRALSRPGDRLFLLCGTDMMLTLDQWREPEEIFRLCYPVYIRREDDRTQDSEIIRKIALYRERYGKVVRRIVAPVIDMSSSQIRAAVATGACVENLVPPDVAAYIRKKHLYEESDPS